MTDTAVAEREESHPPDDASRTLTKSTIAIFLVSLAGLLLEVGYTRIISFKLWYYYTYLVIGLALLGIGSGAILVVVVRRLRQASTDAIIAGCALVGAVVIAVGYFIISRVPIDTVRIWVYGSRSSYKNVAVLGFICFVLFASFLAFGIIIATLLGRATDRVNRLYFADLVGAGLGCLFAIPLIVIFGPPQVIMIAALILAAVSLIALPNRDRRVAGVGIAVCAVLVVLSSGVIGLPDVRVEETKGPGNRVVYSDWGPVFRVDVVPVADDRALLTHDGTFGSAMNKYNGDPSTLGRYKSDPRALPFRTLGTPPDHELIIGSAAGNEILGSLAFGAHNIDAVELNPVTVSLLTDHFADYTGHLDKEPGVHIHQGDGRNYLARSDTDYDLIWYVAPDSYAVANAASSGAFVLSESYLYTSEMIADSLRHLDDDGIMVAQFGELDFQKNPSRTARYIMTARKAFRELGIENPADHIIVSPLITNKTGDLSTIILKRTPFTPEEVSRYRAAVPQVPLASTAYAPGDKLDGDEHLVAKLASLPTAEANAAAAEYPREISAISDDKPFFWHFSGFSTVLRNIFHPFDASNPEDVIGERVLLLLLTLSILFAAVFMLAPFVLVRREWRRLPAKGISAVYFAALGLGFMFFEITMIQRLVRFLGYPTYSLTVTLASILVFTGIGALLSKRFADRPARAMPVLFGILCALTVFYVFALDNITDSLLTAGLPARIIVTLLLLAPLGLCLGAFMPLGLGVVADLSEHADEYVAWSWAVNGAFSVMGSVLTTILAMTFGFRIVQSFGVVVYAIAALAMWRLASYRTRVLSAAE